MLMGSADIVVWVFLLILIGIVGFFVMSVVLVARFLGFLLRLLTGRSGERVHHPVRSDGPGGVCSHPRCGHCNPPGARFCRRCGRGFHVEVSADTYG